VNGNEINETFMERLRSGFRADAEHLAAHERARLAIARRRAMEASAPRPGGVGFWLPAGAAAAVAALTLAVLMQEPTAPTAPAGQLAEIQDLEILLSEHDLEMFAELEFYLWLSEQTGDRRDEA
jgi:hypothetical protein